ncbi:hypothetical protein [Streptomyces hebeiensis]
MPDQRYSALSVRQLAGVVDGMAGSVSAERLRQLRMIVGMWDRAVGREEMPGRAVRGARQLFSGPALRAFWWLAVAGELRAREADRGRELPLATQRIVRDCLVMLGAEVVPGKRLPLPVLDQVELKETVPERQLPALYRELVDLAHEGPLQRGGAGLSLEDRTRLLALVAVMLDAAPRAGELEAMNVADLGEDLATVRVVRRPQNRSGVRHEDVAYALELPRSTVSKVLSGNEAYRAVVSTATWQRVEAAAARWDASPRVETYPLREGSRVAVRRWLRLREDLVGSLEGGRDALWVTIAPSKAGPPGIRMRAQGIRMAYARGMTALNMLMAGQYGWSPMPAKLEQLRRAVDVEPLEDRARG